MNQTPFRPYPLLGAEFLKGSTAAVVGRGDCDSRFDRFDGSPGPRRRQQHDQGRPDRLRRPRHGAAEQALTADIGHQARRDGRRLPGPARRQPLRLKGTSAASRVDVPKDRQYTGFEAYKHVIDQVDLVLLTTPPGFRPLHLAYAVEKGVNAFVEKPMAVDGPGLRNYQACKDAKTKNLSLVNGFCWRYDGPRRETMKQVFDGKIGDVVAIETTYNSHGVWEPRKTRGECASDMEYQMRNWYYYGWLSGDHIVEQAVHGIDTMGWVMGDKLRSLLGCRRPPVPH